MKGLGWVRVSGVETGSKKCLSWCWSLGERSDPRRRRVLGRPQGATDSLCGSTSGAERATATERRSSGRQELRWRGPPASRGSWGGPNRRAPLRLRVRAPGTSLAPPGCRGRNDDPRASRVTPEKTVDTRRDSSRPRALGQGADATPGALAGRGPPPWTGAGHQVPGPTITSEPGASWACKPGPGTVVLPLRGSSTAWGPRGSGGVTPSRELGWGLRGLGRRARRVRVTVGLPRRTAPRPASFAPLW